MTKKMTQTTGDQKSARAWINRYAQYNLAKGLQTWLRYLATNCFWQERGKSYKVPRDFQVSHRTIAKNIPCAVGYAQEIINKAEMLEFSSTIKGANGQRDAYALHIDRALAKTTYRPSKEIKAERDKARSKTKMEWNRTHPKSQFEDAVRSPMTIERLRNGNQKPSSFLLNSKVECAKASYAAVTALVQRNLSTQVQERQEQNAPQHIE